MGGKWMNINDWLHGDEFSGDFNSLQYNIISIEYPKRVHLNFFL